MVTQIVRGALSQSGQLRLDDFLIKKAKTGVDKSSVPFYDKANILLLIEKATYPLTLQFNSSIIVLSGSFTLKATDLGKDLQPRTVTLSGNDEVFTLTASDFDFSLAVS
jgi:hypothetical protein